MIKDIHFTSQYHAERVEGRLDTIVVSIHSRHSKPKLRGGFRDVLYLAFDDYDRERDGTDALMEPFSPKQADTLKHWLETYLRADTTYRLLIHCHAGISRSAAIAYWAHKAHGLELRTDYPTCYLNRHVLRTLDPSIDPPQRPDDVPEMPTDRSFGQPPLLRQTTARKTLVLLAHDKESDPGDMMFRHLTHIAKRQGALVLDADCSDIVVPEECVRRLVAFELPEHQDLLMVGAGIGGYIAAMAAATLKSKGLFLLAPAIGIPGYAGYPTLPRESHMCVVHGWQDDVIPVEYAINFAKGVNAQLHLLKGDHHLNSVLPEVGTLFEQFLAKVMAV